MALSAAGSASALIYEQVYTGTVKPFAVDGGLFGGLSGGEAFTLRFVTDTTLGAGIVNGPDGQRIDGGYNSGTSAPVTVFVTVDGQTHSFVDNIAVANAQILYNPSKLEAINVVVYSASSVGELNFFASAAGIGLSSPVTFGKSYEISSFADAPYVALLGHINDHGIYFEMAVTSAYGRVISAVPEPATWAMMMLGFTGLGGALRVNRRRQAVAA